ncbi:MGMT family protein [Zophobihabitans entericus]|uniref:MGMT family protein n=1 Tax=Zophobihabitans entericus TaxID=1635327 RepID=A0A6G9IBW2_9GAMM|nr:MGMT family protein [Zophobihabitans entericus]QIQ21322.1 MGMT family protein [Zophobihabitans entericus]
MEAEFDNFSSRVYAVIAQIPKGKVATYGQIARLAGAPTYIRQVCFALRKMSKDTKLPYYRIINSQGKISVKNESYLNQKQKLLGEGIAFGKNDKVDLKKFGWEL